ncbi:acyltransferase family protein [Pandoraea apista]|uniref:acyltransferase family protein n=1 Tax=Pandoraea apista TaxID=93218 RepID=UPI000659A6E2|nr:acyltransferase [Pandoraea apista]ALS64560.1 hypothetical protein AT395_05790 [Pandoraea apista]RRW97421.1 acyltransferase [Pandoraea apista]RRW99232.1 acyltransferase [Pandoraea apista]CFB64480.1 O-acetyltransferase OatA [Pandoraea apista]
MIYSVQCLRGIAALLVVMYHYRDFLDGVYAQGDLGQLLFRNGHAGVDLFFMISGFIIVFSTQRDDGQRLISFVVKRAFRIYPLLIICVIAFFFVNTPPEIMSERASVARLLKSLIPLNSDYNGQAPFFGYNLLGPAWTLSYEMYFYAAFAISITMSHRYRVAICSILLLAIGLGLQFKFNGAINLDPFVPLQHTASNSFNGHLQVLASPMIYEFIVGMLLAAAFPHIHKISALTSGNRPKILLWCACVTVGALLLTHVPYQHGVLGFGAWGLFVLTASLIYEASTKPKPLPVLLFFGEISYSLYLVHMIVWRAWDAHRTMLPSYLNGLPLLALMLGTSILSAYGLHVVIEKPAIRFARRLLSKIYCRTLLSGHQPNGKTINAS